MNPTRFRAWFFASLLICASSCTMPKTRPYIEPPPPDLKPVRIDYADTDAFDAVLETNLTVQEPVILIQTHNREPNWEGRLNAWLAAWNLGGPVQAEPAGRRVRMQAAVVVDGDSIREFRLLVEGVMNRIEGIARDRAAWWTEEKTRNRRVALLKPYNLRFHQDEQGQIQIIFFNGRYAAYYPEYVRSLARGGEEESEWTRAFSCSRCKQGRGAAEGDE